MPDLHAPAHAVTVTWRGEALTTLADLWPEGARVAVVALHPFVCGVEAGHHFHKRLGRAALTQVAQAAGVVVPGEAPLDDVLVAAGIAVCSVVPRPGPRESALYPGDVQLGVRQLVSRLVDHGIRLVVCPFEPAAPALAGRAVAPGRHTSGVLEGVDLFRMPPPFASRAERDTLLVELREALREIDRGSGAAARQGEREPDDRQLGGLLAHHSAHLSDRGR